MGAKRKAKGPKAPKPALSETTLSQLTSKIETTLSKPKDESSAKRKRRDEDTKDANPKKRPAHESKDGSRKPKKETKTTLLEEIKLLGGDEADLELVGGVDSDAEEGKEPKSKGIIDVDDALKNELASFAAELGFEKARDEDIATDEVLEEMEAIEEEEEEESASEDEPESEPKAAAPPAVKPQSRFGAGKLVFEPRTDWHTLSQEELPAPASDDFPKFSTTVSSLKAHGRALLDADAAAYNKTVASSSTHKFMSTIMASGTMSDKVSALTLAIQESPVHNIKALESLITMAGKKSRGQAIAALGALVDLLGNGVVLPNDRRLRPFHAQPGLLGTLQQESVNSWKPEKPLPGRITQAHLIMWVYEDWLKETYFKMIQLLEMWAGDEIEYSRSRAIDFVYGLLRDKPEQEANLLRLLVNKLGDRDRKIASRASHLLLQLLNIHPGMKTVVINTMEQEVLLKPSQSLRSKYYAMNSLNQTILSGKEPQIADTLVRIYFELFVSLLKTGSLGSIGYSTKSEEKSEDKPKGKRGFNMQEYKSKKKGSADKAGPAPDVETAEKLVTAILTGINRAVPFSNTDDATLEKHLDTLFKITHSSNFNTSIQALILIQQLSISKHLAVDRFYRTLYESLLDPRLITSSKQALYLNLIFRSLKNDVDVRRVKAFVKRMLQICYLHQPSFACGILFLITQLQQTFPDLKTLLNEPEEDGDDEEVYKDAPEEGAEEAVEQDSKPSKNAYDGRKRDPQYSNADQSCMWEIIPYFKHFHPSVSVFAENLLVRQKSVPKPELANHTLMHFLDKFVYRNAKATDSNRGGSIMQPGLASGGGAAQIVVPGKAAAKQESTLNSAAFWNLKQEDVAAEDVFFHEYFSQIGKPGQKAKANKSKDGVEGEEDDEAEDEIWEALVNSHPDVGGDDADADLDMGSDDESDLGSLLNMSSDDDDDEKDDVLLSSDTEGVQMEGFDDEDGEDDWVDGDDLDKDSDEEESADKKSRGKDGKSKMSKRDMKKLPTFATADDYAALLAEEEEEVF